MTWRAERVAFADVAALQEALEVPEPVAWVLVRRGLADPAAAREFMASDGPLAPPEDLPGIAEAADRLAKALASGERIAVHGDYDCDGISSTAILVSALRGRGGDVVPFLPSRFREGYGVAVESVEALADAGARVLVCVDCGTSAIEALTRAVELGMDPVTLDHHLAGGRRPPGIIANPALGRPAEDLPAAAGVVHMLVRALAARVDGGGLAPDPDESIDLVALATVADAVPLVGDNRRRVARGLRAMREHPRPGIAALCAAAGLEPRSISARALGFTLAPSINAAGRMSHPERGLELLLAPDRATADPLGAELWALNAERREVERGIVELAIAQVEAEPDEIRAHGVVVAAGDDWHEGVVGIVASRLAERFERPAIVLSRQGDTAKGSGRSVPGVDLHSLVSGAAASLTRWGGHAGAIGLELPATAIVRFRDELALAAEGVRSAIARARIRTVDAVAAGRDLTLATAEEIERLAPFGRGNPPVRLVLPGVALESPGRVGDGQHLQVRIRSGGVHARAIGFRMGERAPGLDVERRHDAVIELDVERWQGMVGPRVSIQALDPVGPSGGARSPLWEQAAAAHDAGCAEQDLRALAADPLPPVPEPPPGSAPPRGLRDRRGEGAALAAIAALAGADRGVVAVVADAARRREALEAAIDPGRVGAEVVVLGGGRCGADALARSLELARGVPSLAVLEYADLPRVAPPDDAHLVLVDPPASHEEAEWAVHRAAGRWLHLVWGSPEVAAALAASEERWELRPTVTALWIALRDGALRPWGPELSAEILGDPALPRRPRVAARALAVLAELGLVSLDASGVRAAPDPARRELEESAVYRAARERLARQEEFLSRAMTLDLLAPAVAAV